MPCKHVVAVISEMAGNIDDVGFPETWVHNSYWLTTWEKEYSYTINPYTGRPLWKKHPSPYTILPPEIHPQIRRPQKNGKSLQMRYQVQKCLQMVNCLGLGKQSHVLTATTQVTTKGHVRRMFVDHRLLVLVEHKCWWITSFCNKVTKAKGKSKCSCKYYPKIKGQGKSQRCDLSVCFCLLNSSDSVVV